MTTHNIPWLIVVYTTRYVYFYGISIVLCLFIHHFVPTCTCTEKAKKSEYFMTKTTIQNLIVAVKYYIWRLEQIFENRLVSSVESRKKKGIYIPDTHKIYIDLFKIHTHSTPSIWPNNISTLIKSWSHKIRFIQNKAFYL